MGASRILRTNNKIMDMIKISWPLPFLIVTLNALAIIIQWSTLPELLPAHYDLQGNASGTMPRSMLLLYILIGAAVCLISYMVGRMKQKLQTGLVVLTSGICLILFSSTMVTLTSGTMPVFMLAEPVILLASVIGFVICVVNPAKR
jgi:uncharacterized membrane protein